MYKCIVCGKETKPTAVYCCGNDCFMHHMLHHGAMKHLIRRLYNDTMNERDDQVVAWNLVHQIESFWARWLSDEELED